MMNRLMAVLFFLSSIVCGAISYAGEPYLVVKEKVDDMKAVIATVESVREVQARARLSGTISLLAIKEGDRVQKGEQIALVGDPKLAIIGQGLESRIKAAQSAFDKAKLDFARAKDLRASGYGTQARLDEARTALSIAENDLHVAQSGRKEVTQRGAEGAVLAPSAGRVLKVPVTMGSVVMAGETVAVLSQENYILRMALPERHARFIHVGDSVFIGKRGLDIDGEEELRGIVKLVYPEIQNGRVIADVEAEGLGDYFVGERAKLYVSAGERTGYFIPKAFLSMRAGLAYVRLENGMEVLVQTGEARGQRIEILAGLIDGDKVVAP